jgi:hypothetical protein
LKYEGKNQLPKHFVFRLTINEPSFQKDATHLGDRTLMLTLNDEGKFVFSTNNHKFNEGHDRIDLYKPIDTKDQLGEWCWVYFGFNRATRTALAYVRWAGKEDFYKFTDVQHFLPKYFGLTVGNQGSANGWNGWLKQTYLCIGKGCYTD